ncbi:restriction endonuclease subunit S [Pseudarthrobacter oxydans]|uniref:restriction endonuclease subunit S n=1 Tax=Pseudarthrobacter oxydans TaxID=1671 RepID=UPI0034135C80
MVRLGDVASFIRGVTFKPADVEEPSDSNVDCMRTKNVQSELDRRDVWAVPKTTVKRPDQFLREGDLLVSSANSWNLVGKACWIPELERPTTFGGFVSVLRPENVDARYLFRWFSSDIVQATMRSFGNQTTNISNLDLRRASNLLLPLPPLDEQRRIAAILEKADELRTKRREALAHLDTLTRSIFHSMFGDPVTNPEKWPLAPLSSLGILDRGVSKHRPRNDPRLLGGRYPLVQTGDVAGAGAYLTRFSSTYSDLGLGQSRLWPRGTLCITIAANIAKTAILKIEACFPDSVVGFTADPATTEYVRVWLSFLQATLEARAPESAQKNINLAILRTLPVPVPPIELQQTFATRVAAVERLKEMHRKHLAELDALFASLQHRAFKGEL